MTKAGELSSNSICNIKSFDSFMTTYDDTNGFSALIFKVEYNSQLSLSILESRLHIHGTALVTTIEQAIVVIACPVTTQSWHYQISENTLVLHASIMSAGKVMLQNVV